MAQVLQDDWDIEQHGTGDIGLEEFQASILDLAFAWISGTSATEVKRFLTSLMVLSCGMMPPEVLPEEVLLRAKT